MNKINKLILLNDHNRTNHVHFHRGPISNPQSQTQPQPVEPCLNLRFQLSRVDPVAAATTAELSPFPSEEIVLSGGEVDLEFDVEEDSTWLAMDVAVVRQFWDIQFPNIRSSFSFFTFLLVVYFCMAGSAVMAGCMFLYGWFCCDGWFYIFVWLVLL